MAFLVFEGIDGSGKSTLLNLLCEELKKRDLNFICTREPGGTYSGQKIRDILLDRQNTTIHPLTETLLYYADRKQHIEELIKPSLAKGFWLLSDRYWASASAYQCGGRGLEEKFINELKTQVCSDCEPDLWILLDLPVEVSLKRLLVSRKDYRDRFEREEKDFHQRVRDYYLKLAKEDPSKWLILDATKPPEKLLEQILSCLKHKFFYRNRTEESFK